MGERNIPRNRSLNATDATDAMRSRAHSRRVPVAEDRRESAADSGSPLVTLGSDPGMLLACLPSLLGFTPEESVVLVGLYNASATQRAMRIGPVARADLNPASLLRAIDRVMYASQSLREPEVALVVISRNNRLARSLLTTLGELFESELIGINGLRMVTHISEGVEWFYPDGTCGGVVGSVNDNPLTTISQCTGALRMESREDRERWLHPRVPRIDAGDILAAVEYPTDAAEAVQMIFDMTTFLEDLGSGQHSLETLLENDDLLNRLLSDGNG